MTRFTRWRLHARQFVPRRLQAWNAIGEARAFRDVEGAYATAAVRNRPQICPLSHRYWT